MRPFLWFGLGLRLYRVLRACPTRLSDGVRALLQLLLEARGGFGFDMTELVG